MKKSLKTVVKKITREEVPDAGFMKANTLFAGVPFNNFNTFRKLYRNTPPVNQHTFYRKNCFVFAVFRDPHERLVSSFASFRLQKNIDVPLDRLFEEWEVYAKEGEFGAEHAPQAAYVPDDATLIRFDRQTDVVDHLREKSSFPEFQVEALKARLEAKPPEKPFRIAISQTEVVKKLVEKYYSVDLEIWNKLIDS